MIKNLVLVAIVFISFLVTGCSAKSSLGPDPLAGKVEITPDLYKVLDEVAKQNCQARNILASKFNVKLFEVAIAVCIENAQQNPFKLKEVTECIGLVLEHHSLDELDCPEQVN